MILGTPCINYYKQPPTFLDPEWGSWWSNKWEVWEVWKISEDWSPLFRFRHRLEGCRFGDLDLFVDVKILQITFSTRLQLFFHAKCCLQENIPKYTKLTWDFKKHLQCYRTCLFSLQNLWFIGRKSTDWIVDPRNFSPKRGWLWSWKNAHCQLQGSECVQPDVHPEGQTWSWFVRFSWENAWGCSQNLSFFCLDLHVPCLEKVPKISSQMVIWWWWIPW